MMEATESTCVSNRQHREQSGLTNPNSSFDSLLNNKWAASNHFEGLFRPFYRLPVSVFEPNRFEVVCGLCFDLSLLNGKGIFSKLSYALVLGADAGLPDCAQRFQPGWTFVRVGKETYGRMVKH